jgi:hypothetical protein
LTRSFGKFAIAALVVAAAMSPREVRAASVTLAPDAKDSFDVLWSLMVGTTELTALGEFDVNVTDTYVDFYVTLTNNTTLVSEKVHSIGFNTDPNGTALTVLDSGVYFQNFALDQKFPSFKKVDICAWGTQNCQGGGQGSNLPGGGAPVGTDSFAFRLAGDFSDGLTVDRFVIKFQGTLGSFEFEDTPSRPPTVPEPSSVVLLAMGALASMVASRRRRVQ